MSLRCRGASAAGVAYFIAFLLTNYFQPIFSEGCGGGNCPTRTQPTATQRTCSPAQPYLNFSVGLVTSDKIRIEWDPLTCIDANGMFAYYRAVIRHRNTGRLVGQKKSYGISSSSVTFKYLLPCTTYDFSLRAVNYGPLPPYIAWSPDAESAITTTAKVINARVSQRSSSSLGVAWNVSAQCQDTTINYTLTYELTRQEGCPEGYMVSPGRITITPISGNSYEITSLQPFATYAISISITGGADENFSLAGMTMPTALSTPPKRVECTHQSYDSLTFTWNKRRCGYRNGPISNYEYILNASGSNVPILGSVNGSENGGNITFTDLIPGTMYSFRVRANSYNLSGIYGQAVEANTNITIYHPPGNVVVTSRSETTAVVKWSAPEISVFNTFGYMILCWQSGFKENTSIVVLYEEEVCAPPCLMEATITGLKPASNHSIQLKVAALYKYGEEKSRVLRFQTPEKVRESSLRQAVMIPVLVCMFLVFVVILLVIASLLYSRKTKRPLFGLKRFSFSVPGILNARRGTGTALKKSAPMSRSRNRNHTERELNGGKLEMEIT